MLVWWGALKKVARGIAIDFRVTFWGDHPALWEPCSAVHYFVALSSNCLWHSELSRFCETTSASPNVWSHQRGKEGATMCEKHFHGFIAIVSIGEATNEFFVVTDISLFFHFAHFPLCCIFFLFSLSARNIADIHTTKVDVYSEQISLKQSEPPITGHVRFLFILAITDCSILYILLLA